MQVEGEKVVGKVGWVSVNVVGADGMMGLSVCGIDRCGGKGRQVRRISNTHLERK